MRILKKNSTFANSQMYIYWLANGDYLKRFKTLSIFQLNKIFLRMIDFIAIKFSALNSLGLIQFIIGLSVSSTGL